MLKVNLDDMVEYTGLPPLTAVLTLIEYASLAYNRTPKVKYEQKRGMLIIESLIIYSKKYDLKKIFDHIKSPYQDLLKLVLQELIKKFNIDVYLLRVTFYNYLSLEQKTNAVSEECEEGKRRYRPNMC